MNISSRRVIGLMLIACIVWIVWMLASTGAFGSR
jgi:hypothetical protein